MLTFAAPQEITLRPYQADAIEGLRQNIRAGKRKLILCAGTGSGKSICAAHLLNEADRKGSYALFLVDRVALVNQISATLDSYGIRHGVVQGIHDRYAPRENVQVASIQTLARRVLPRQPNLIVWDECHSLYRSTLGYVQANPQAVTIGLTATPFTAGMADHWEGMVNVIPTQRLIDEGYLIAPTIYVARSPDDSELGLNSYGEFSEESATRAGIRIVGDVVSEWIAKTAQHFGGPVKTIVFSPTVEHGRELCASFAAAGYNFQQVSYLDRSDDERAAKISEFRRPDSIIHGLVSCGVLTRGFDVPDVRCGISCRPYRKSLSSHMQEIGRVMRPSPGKDAALWLDHAGNIERFALDMFDIWQNGVGELSQAIRRDSVARERTKEQRAKAVCPECSGAIRDNTCMACGWQRPVRSGVQAVQGEMTAYQPADALQAREGLRAECLRDPRKVWHATLRYTTDNCRNEDTARRWAYKVWAGIYSGAKLPVGWYKDSIPTVCDLNAYGLIGREVKRYRKTARAAA
jgi:superfamily II DNA or RNA helicase